MHNYSQRVLLAIYEFNKIIKLNGVRKENKRVKIFLITDLKLYFFKIAKHTTKQQPNSQCSPLFLKLQF